MSDASHPHHEIVKEAAALELGIDGIEDPEELRSAVRAKLESLDPLAQAAFEMRLGQIARAQAAGGAPSTKSRVLVYAIVIVVSWFIWRPLAFVISILAIANARRFAIRHSMFWAPTGAILFGAAYGSSLGILARLASILAVHTTLGSLLFAVLGLFAAAYLGYGVEQSPLLRRPEDDKRILAQVVAVTAYALVLVTWIGIEALLNRA